MDDSSKSHIPGIGIHSIHNAIQIIIKVLFHDLRQISSYDFYNAIISYDLKCRIVVLPKTEQNAPSKVKGFCNLRFPCLLRRDK